MAEQVVVARARELSQLQHFLERALGGNGQVVLVTGEAGAGKAAWVTESARWAEVHHTAALWRLVSVTQSLRVSI